MILVTGGNGLLGSYLLRNLIQRNERVTAIYRSCISDLLSDEENAKINWVKGDVLDVVLLNELMQQCDYVYHCAGVVSFHPKRRHQMYKINIEGTENIVNAALANNIKKLIHVSSVAAIGRIRNNEMIHEQMQWSEETNNSHYGKTKFLSEMEVWRGIAEGLNAVIVNPVIILGVGNWHQGSTALFKKASESFAWYTEGVTGFVDAGDCAEAMVQLMQNNISGERFILSAENKSYQEVLTAMAKEFGTKPPYRKAQPWMGELIWRIEAIRSSFSMHEPLMTKETAKTGQAKAYFDNRKILNALPNFQFRPLENTIRETCAALTKKYLA